MSLLCSFLTPPSSFPSSPQLDPALLSVIVLIAQMRRPRHTELGQESLHPDLCNVYIHFPSLFTGFCETHGQVTQTQGVPLEIQVPQITNWSLVRIFLLLFFEMLVVAVSFPLGKYNLLKPKLFMGADLTNFSVQNHFLQGEALKLLKRARLFFFF